MDWETIIDLLEKNKKRPCELDVIAKLNIFVEELELEDPENGVIARRLARAVYESTGYRYIYKNTQSSRTTDKIKTYIFFCAQCKGEERNQHLVENPEKRRSRLMMDRFNCNGSLRIMMTDGDCATAGIRFTHHQAHTPYLDISLGAAEKALVAEMKNLPPSKVCSPFLSSQSTRIHRNRKRPTYQYSALLNTVQSFLRSSGATCTNIQLFH
ncbi:hypothetical protein C8J56DRAFT_1091359 [Mycena floridula]|nr:hypothetical protein C8J56DRAFT_1091359 [Mycena floridula]